VVINWFAAEVKNGRAYKTPNLINMMEALNWHPQSTEEQVFACLAKKQYSECIAFGTQAVEPMLTALSIAEKDDVPSIVRTLCALGDPRAIDVIGDALLGKDTDLRLNALESLERIQNSRAVPWLIKALMKYPDELQEKIASALNRLVPLNWSRDMLAPLLDSYKPELTVFILEILGRTGDTRALPVLKEKLANPLPQIRLACSKALALCGEPQWENIIRGEKEDFERLIIAGNTDALTILIRRLEDYDFEIRKSAAQAFQRIVKSGPEMLRREWGKIHKLITEPRKAETIVNLMSFDSSDSSTRDTGIGMEFPAAFPE
ncbi:MAG: HEAT repeat domain-containing protein, partial [Brevinematales bacterium]